MDGIDGTKEIEQLRTQLTEYTKRVEQLEVQLAGCATAALGWNKDPALEGQYGWSPSYQDVLHLRRKFEILKKALEKISYADSEELVAKVPTTEIFCQVISRGALEAIKR